MQTYRYFRKVYKKIDRNTWFAQATFNLYGKEVIITPQGQTSYNIQFQEKTVIDLLLMDGSKESMYQNMEVDAWNIEIRVGSGGLPSVYNYNVLGAGIITSEYIGYYTSVYDPTTRGIPHFITGEQVYYNEPIVIISYKRKKEIPNSVQSTGFLKFKNATDGWYVEELEYFTILKNEILFESLTSGTG